MPPDPALVKPFVVAGKPYPTFTLALGALAELFPATFTTEQHLLHRRPIKRGIHLDLLAAGILATRKDAHRLVGPYCGHRMYLLAVCEGAVRVDLDGNPAGIVTAEEAAKARADLNRLDAASDHRALEAQQARAAARAARKARCAAKKALASPLPPAPPAPPPGPRVGLSGLKAAALARRNSNGAIISK
jgi:sRNA-binding protein